MIKKIKHSQWDATIDTSMVDKYNNAELTLELRIAFKKINPPAGAISGIYHDYGDKNAPVRKIVKWKNSDWNAWKMNFISSAQRYWQDRFWLENNFGLYEYDDSGIKYIPNIWCRFKLKGSDASSAFKHHHMIEVVKLDKAETWFGSHSTLYDSLDSTSVQKGIDSKGKPIMQKAHVHEIGHLLGLGHVDEGKPHCPPNNTNASKCYGVMDKDKNSVMGQGMQLRTKHANPWRNAIIKLTGKGNFFKELDWTAKTQRHYPRNLLELKKNKHIIVKPKR